MDYETIKPVDAVIVAVAHSEYKKITPEQLRKKIINTETKPVLIDVKGLYKNYKDIKEKFLYWEL